jgi:hypothetical protein
VLTGDEDWLMDAFEDAMKGPLPKAADKFISKRLKLLVALCRRLQRAAEELKRPGFYLSCRAAGRLLNVSHVTASEWFTVLQEAGVLALLVRGSKKSGMASQYRYLGD